MGLLTKIIVIAIIIAALWYASGTVKIDTMTVCIKHGEETYLDIGCTTDQNCVDYLTSPYIEGYPDSKVYKNIVSATTSCQEGVCELKKFHYADTCAEGEEMMPFKVTLKDILAKQGIKIP